MTSLGNPHPRHTYEWWIHEGGVSEEDGHPDAARSAYNQAAQSECTDYQKVLAEYLRDVK